MIFKLGKKEEEKVAHLSLINTVDGVDLQANIDSESWLILKIKRDGTISLYRDIRSGKTGFKTDRYGRIWINPEGKPLLDVEPSEY